MPKLLFLGCNHDQVPYLEALRGRGFIIIGTDSNQEAPGIGLCDKFYNVNYDDTLGLIDIGLKEQFSTDDYVFTAAAQFAHRGAAVFAEYFNIQYPEVKAVDLCLDKSVYYEYFRNNNIPIPETSYITSEQELTEALSNTSGHQNYYLKSDFSKNPNYVYRFSINNIPWDKLFWGRDRYLREKYILQQEFNGVSVRINIYGDRFNVYDFNTGKKTVKYHNELSRLGVIKKLRNLMNILGMPKWLLKFDVILDDNAYAVLDIGLDPPYRMVHEAKSQSINFMDHYLNQYLFNKISYPEDMD
jgi:hypothetical protein